LTCSLTRDGANVSNPDSNVLDVGTYIYNYSTPGNENYSAGSDNETVTITKSTPTVTLQITPGVTVLMN